MIALEGHKVTIRSILSHEIPELWQMVYGSEFPEWKQWDAPYFPLDPVSLPEFTHRVTIRQEDPEAASQLGIIVGGRIIGTVSYYWEHKPSLWLEVGIAIHDPAYWNGGYGTEALQLYINYLFARLPLVRVGLTTWSGNFRMIRCAEKLGMQMEGRLRKCRFYNGEFYDSIRMGMLREEWQAQGYSTAVPQG